MNANTNEGINVANATEVLANCLLKSHQAYLTVVEDGFSSDLYREMGRTVRSLAQALVDVSMPYDAEFDDLANLEEEEQDV